MANVTDVIEQFRDLSFSDVSRWPLLPRIVLWLVLLVFTIGMGWSLFWSDQLDALERLRNEETKLRTEYQTKITTAINLPELTRQRDQVAQYVQSLEKQLPSKAEIDALLSDINRAGVGRGLQFELFRPGAVATKDYYAELPITLRISGRYHDLGAFAADVAALPRIVVLHNVGLDAGRDGSLAMDATARTFRYLDEEELAKQRTARSAAKKGRP